jgi:hypothetical protein
LRTSLIIDQILGSKVSSSESTIISSNSLESGSAPSAKNKEMAIRSSGSLFAAPLSRDQSGVLPLLSQEMRVGCSESEVPSSRSNPSSPQD